MFRPLGPHACELGTPRAVSRVATNKILIRIRMLINARIVLVLVHILGINAITIASIRTTVTSFRITVTGIVNTVTSI